MLIIKFEKNRMLSLSNKVYLSYHNQENYYIWKKIKKLKKKMLKIKHFVEIEIIFIMQVNTEVVYIVYAIYNMIHLNEFL